MKKYLTMLAASATLLSIAANLPELYFNPPPRIMELSQDTTMLIANGKSDLEIVAPAEAGESVEKPAEAEGVKEEKEGV